MKKCLYRLLISILPLAWACGKEDPDPTPTPDPAPKAVLLNTSSLSVKAEGGSFEVVVTSPFVPQVDKPAWITVHNGTMQNYSVTVTITVVANTAYESRTAELTFSATGASSAKLSVTQEAADKPDDPQEGEIAATLTNPNASAAAQKVFTFLKEHYGSKVMSGVQSGGTANNNENLDAIFKLTGKHPAVSGYDFIFLQYSPTPESWEWKVNYGDISAAKEHWEKNGLVSYMWHWNVPTSKEAWDKGLGGDFSGYGYYTDKTNFDINRALVAGNWENDFLLKDIEKVAGYLKLLQQEGIPVIWRPLHEAAGNYNLYSSNGAWFWWGKGGAVACKKLWKLLRDKLEGEYGLNNLIWVWTLDATQGAESQYADWYPGNELVDIVGVDIYEDNTAAKTRQFKAAQSLSGGKKMTTISECGNIPDPQKCFAAKESWSWFLTWSLSQEDYKYNTDSYWKQLMGSSSVLSREAMSSLK